MDPVLLSGWNGNEPQSILKHKARICDENLLDNLLFSFAYANTQGIILVSRLHTEIVLFTKALKLLVE